MIDEFIRNIKRSSSYKKQIAHLEVIPPQEANYGELEKALPANIQNCLIDRKIQIILAPSRSDKQSPTRKKHRNSHPNRFWKDFSFQHSCLRSHQQRPKSDCALPLSHKSPHKRPAESSQRNGRRNRS